MYTDMDWWTRIRRRIKVDGVSKRQVMREEGIHWRTLEKVLTHSDPPGYRLKGPRKKPKIGPYIERIREIIRADKSVHKKQRHTAKRIFERIREEGYEGGYTQVKEAVREIKRRTKEVYVPLSHPPGEAQVDFGEALVKMGGILRKVVFFVMALPYSDAFFLQAFERICTETWWEGHVKAFRFFGGVPRRITYDNDKTLVAQIIGAHERKLTRGFLQLQSHYLFDTHFCRVRRANEKGVVEGTVKFSRRNFLVPVPQVRDFDELNARLVEMCREDLKRKVRGKGAEKKALLREDRAAFFEEPQTPFDACRKVSTTASSLSLVRFDRNDYSVPVRYAHHPVVVKGYTDRVEICFKGQIIADHRRLWSQEDVSFDPVHYLALLERKPGALDHARPLEGWHLPECFDVLRKRLENALGKKGTGEYIRVLRLLEKHSPGAVTRAVEKGLKNGVIIRDGIAQYLFPQEEWGETKFSLAGREHLRYVKVAKTDISAYGTLLSGQGA